MDGLNQRADLSISVLLPGPTFQPACLQGLSGLPDVKSERQNVNFSLMVPKNVWEPLLPMPKGVILCLISWTLGMDLVAPSCLTLSVVEAGLLFRVFKKRYCSLL